MSPTSRSRRGPGNGTPDLDQNFKTADRNHDHRQASPRLAEDADVLLDEISRWLEAASSVLEHALLDGDRDVLVDAAGHGVVCVARARRLLSAAVHRDLEAVLV